MRYPPGFKALLLAAFLLGATAAHLRADNTAPDRGTDNVASLTDPVPSLPEEEIREPAFGDEPRPSPAIADPIKPFNRAVFAFNDKAYYWFFKPVAKGYNFVVPEGVRVSVRNFFTNLATPVRAANNLLQGDPGAFGTELLRFAVNSTAGILGLFDPARDSFHIEKKEADLGQTLGKYGLGQGIYIVLPLLGPTTLRDGVGSAGDAFLDPLSYLRPPEAAIGVNAYKTENGLSLRLGAYEELTEAAVDPYIAVRDAYVQYRANLVRGKGSPAP